VYLFQRIGEESGGGGRRISPKPQGTTLGWKNYKLRSVFISASSLLAPCRYVALLLVSRFVAVLLVSRFVALFMVSGYVAGLLL
jgi:hypothetical protein